MATCALVNKATGKVENMVVASASDPAPDGYEIVADPPPHVILGTNYKNGQFEPPDPHNSFPYRRTEVDGELWGGTYILYKIGDKFPLHTHLEESNNHITQFVSGGVMLHGEFEGREVWADRDGYPVFIWTIGVPHGWTALADRTAFANWRKVRVKV